MDMLSTRNFEVFKEPRGLIRVIQLLFAVLAFATTAGYSSVLKFSYECKSGGLKGKREMRISYPFWFDSQSTIEPLGCGAVPGTDSPPLYHPYGAYTAAAQFYVFVGVMAFLYTIFVTVLYVMFDNVYRDNDRVPQADFIITTVWAVVWFIASIALSVKVSFLKLETDPLRLWHQIPECMHGESSVAKCSVLQQFGYSGLNISLICGYANVFLWASNLWFLFKETSWWRSLHPEEAYGGEWYAGDNKNVVETGAGIP